MSRKPCCVGEGLKKGAWTAEEDKKLISYIHENGEGGWRDIPQKAGLKRCGKSCRLRWANYLKPDIKRGEFSYEEEQIIIMLHASRGNKWSVIARHLPKRTDNEIKNYWNTHLKKRLIDQGIDPVTHKPLPSSPCPDSSSKNSDLLNDTKPDEEQYSHSGSISPNSLLLSSDSQAMPEINENPRDVSPSFKRSRSTSRLLNKVATKAGASIGKILSASMEGTLINTSTTLPSSLNEFSENIQFQMDQFDQLFSQSSDHVTDHQNLDINNSHEYNFSQFLDQFSHNDEVETEKINGGYKNNQDLLMSDVSSTSVDDEDNIIENITGWSNYLLDNLDFIYEMDQDSNQNK